MESVFESFATESCVRVLCRRELSSSPSNLCTVGSIEPTVQRFDGLEDSSRLQSTRTQLSVAKDSKTDSITKTQAQFALQGPEDHSQYKRLEAHWIEGNYYYSKEILITWRTN